jgi:hypothetical protein
MSTQPPPLFDSSVAALSLINPLGLQDSRLAPGIPGGSRGSPKATAMPIRFAPEPSPTANSVDIDDDQTTGPLSLDFEFEFFGVRYTWFDLSSDGFLTFGTNSSFDSAHGKHFIPLNEDLSNFIAFGCVDVSVPGRRIAYEVRGTPGRRRLVLSFTPIPGIPKTEGLGMTTQVILYERTGMIDVHTTRHEAEGCSIDEAAVRLTTSPRGAHP